MIWRSGLTYDRVRRVERALAVAPPPAPAAEPLGPELAALAALAASGELTIRVSGDRVTAVVPDRPGMLSRAAGVLALHALDVRAADVRTAGGGAVMSFTVAPRFGRPPDPALLRDDLRRAVSG